MKQRQFDTNRAMRSNTYINRGGNLGTNIDTSASCVSKSQLPPRPYLPSSASSSDGMMRENYEFLSLSVLRPIHTSDEME